MTCVYIAARFSRLAEMQAHRRQLEDAGHLVTARWLDGGHQMQTAAEGCRFAQEDCADLAAADCLICFTEAPRSHSSGGRHVELGLALAFRKRVLVVGPRENAFHYLPEIEVFAAWDAAFAALAIEP